MSTEALNSQIFYEPSSTAFKQLLVKLLWINCGLHEEIFFLMHSMSYIYIYKK